MKKLFIIASFASLVVGFCAGWNEHMDVLVVGFLAFVALLFIAHLDQIAEIKASGTGFEAKTREVISKAENAVSELQSLAMIYAETSLNTVKRTGRFGNYSDEDEERIKGEVLHVLTELGIPEAEHIRVLREWHKFTQFDYVNNIVGGGYQPAGSEDKELKEDWQRLRDINNIPTPEVVEAFLRKWEFLNDDNEELLKDYQYYIDSREHRRPEVWAARREWCKKLEKSS